MPEEFEGSGEETAGSVRGMSSFNWAFVRLFCIRDFTVLSPCRAGDGRVHHNRALVQ